MNTAELAQLRTALCTVAQALVDVLDTKFNGAKEHPMAKKPWAGFDATTTIVRSEFDMGEFRVGYPAALPEIVIAFENWSWQGHIE